MDDPSATSVNVTIKVSTGSTHAASLTLSDTVAECKERLAELTGIPAAEQRLIYAGHVLKDAQLLSDFSNDFLPFPLSPFLSLC
jgi:hypothetical protein